MATTSYDVPGDRSRMQARGCRVLSPGAAHAEIVRLTERAGDRAAHR